jgi:hypothetical protein
MAVPSACVRICAQASGNWRVSDDGGLEIHRNPIGIVTMLRACGPSGSSVAEGMKKISCNGYRFPPRMRALKSSSDFRSWVNSDFRDMVLPANLVSLGFGSRAETQTETRAAHRQKRCVRLPATQLRPPASAAPTKRARRPTKSRRVGIPGRALNSLLRDSNSLLGIKFGF